MRHAERSAGSVLPPYNGDFHGHVPARLTDEMSLICRRVSNELVLLNLLLHHSRVLSNLVLVEDRLSFGGSLRAQVMLMVLS